MDLFENDHRHQDAEYPEASFLVTRELGTEVTAEEAAHRKKETLGPPNVAGSCKHRDRHQGGGNEKEYLESICVW
jgi:hypothetical protein